jgi:hypothetical protein
MDISNSAAHKRIRMEMMKRNSLKTGIDLSTMTREQAMTLRNIDPELKEYDLTVIGAPSAKRVASPAGANKRSSLPDLRAANSKGKNAKAPVGIDFSSFSELPVASISKNDSQIKKARASVVVEAPSHEVSSKKRKSAPQCLSPLAEAAPASAPQVQARKPFPPVAASSKKRASAGPSETSKAVIAGITAAGMSSSEHAQDLTTKYSMGEVLLLTLSDGRPMCGEIVNLTKDTMILEYSENKVMYRALVKIEYDPDNEAALDDLRCVMEVPL